MLGFRIRRATRKIKKALSTAKRRLDMIAELRNFKARLLKSLPYRYLKQIAEDYGLDGETRDELIENIYFNIPLDVIFDILDVYSSNDPILKKILNDKKQEYKNIITKYRTS